MPLFLPNGSEHVPTEKAALDIGPQNSSSYLENLIAAVTEVPHREVWWQMYRRHPWIRACVDLIADAVAAEGYAIQKVDGENAQSFDAEADSRVAAIHFFFRNAFPKSTLRRELNKASIDNNVFGVAYWRKKRAGKICVSLERLDPRNVVLSKDGKAYLIRKPGQSITDGDRIPIEDVIELGNGVGDPLEGGMSPLDALDMTTGTDMMVRKHRNSFFANAATSGTVLINKSADKKQVEAAQAQIRDEKAGANNAYKPLVLTGDWEVKSMNQSGKQEFDFVKASGISREEVMMVYRVPPGKLFINSGSLGSAGKSEDDATFQQNAVLPLEERIFESLTLGLMHDEWGITDIEMVPKRRASLRLDMFDAAESLVKFGGTGNEARALVNLQPSDSEGMNDPLFISSRQPITEEDIAKSSAATAATKPNDVATPQTDKSKK